MNKQEEIREGMAVRLHIRERSLLKVIDEVSPCNCAWDDIPGCFKNQYRQDAELLLGYLRSQNVGINANPYLVEGLAVTIVDGEQSAIIPIKALAKAGYVLFKPLIEEKVKV